jgi:type I restriction enzyme, S subunit
MTTEKKTYPCELCLSVFLQKNDYLRHINKKYPCVTKERLKELKDNELIDLKEKMTETDALKFLESFFNKIKDLLRDQESITSDRALDVITDFLFLRLLNYEMETNQNMNFITKKYNRKVKISNYDYEIDEYKKYFKWSELMKLVDSIDKDSSNQENKQLLIDVITHIIFGGIFKFNDNTKEIYKNRRFFVKKITTIQRLLKEFNKIDFTKYNVDIKGKAYEMTLQKESVTNSSFGQYFTPTWIDKYMVSNVKIKINSDGSYTKILDPACGTAGILCEYFAEVKRRAEKDKIKLDTNVSNYIYGCEIVDDTLKLAHMNMLLKSGSYNTNLKNVDFLETECLDYVDDKLDANIIMNPPFALTKKYHLYDDDESKKIFFGETKSGTMLFLMAGLNTIKDGNQLIMVLPNGKEIFSKNKEFVNIRKKVMENANIFKIAILPDASFKPYTSVQTLILMMEKGKKTDKIEFVKLEKDKDDNVKEIKLCIVKFKELENKNFSWNYKDYFVEKGIEYKNLKYLTIEEICDIEYGDRIVKKDSNEGLYPVYGGGDITFYTDKYNRTGINFIISRFGMSEKCVRKITGNLWLNDSGMTLKNINKSVNDMYFNYYLLINSKNIYDLSRGSAQKNINIDEFKKMKIPIPPIEIQKIISEELDLLYKIKENNQNILNKLEVQRKGKFELLLDLCENKKESKLCDISLFLSTTKHVSSIGNDIGQYRFYNSSQTDKMYLDYYEIDEESVIIGNGGSICVHYDIKFTPSKHVTVCQSIDKKKYSTKYLYLYLLINVNTLKKLSDGATIAWLNKTNLGNVNIQIPSIKDQETIIKEMEYFDNLKEMYKTHIINTEKQIKEQFEYHLNKCKNSDIKENSKSTKSTKSTKSNEDSDSNKEDVLEKKKSIKTKSTKSTKKEEIDSEDETDSEDEKSKRVQKNHLKKVIEDDDLSDLEKELKKKTTKKIVVEEKKEKKNKSKINKN